MNYKKLYEVIIEKAKVENSNLVVGIERHHILPKSLGGSNKKENIVKLTYRQHYVVHKILVRITYGIDQWKMKCALKRFIYSKNVDINSRDYEKIKKEHAQAQSIFMKNRIVSDVTKKNMSIAQLQRYAETPTHWRGRKHSDETKKKMSEFQSEHNPQKGKPRTEDEKRRISEKMKGVPKSKETVQKFREKKLTPEEKQKISNSIKLWWKERKEKENELKMGQEIS